MIEQLLRYEYETIERKLGSRETLMGRKFYELNKQGIYKVTDYKEYTG